VIFRTEQIKESTKTLVGGKAFALAELIRYSVSVPDFICLSVDAYQKYVEATGLQARIQLEFFRKEFSQMRWEEMWDTALRIQHMFQTTAWPARLREEIVQAIEPEFGSRSVVVRSSAPGEDSKHTSYAGLHESYVNIHGIDAILEHIKLVWASLWSDAALLYRQELGLQVETSSMAVIVQELIAGDVSGIVFSQSPVDASQAVIEAVYGLNQALVDGSTEPDRWTLNRIDGTVFSFQPAAKTNMMVPDNRGVKTEDLSPDKAETPCLSSIQIEEIFKLSQKLENDFSAPQDIEWTFCQGELYTLQSRPITTIKEDPRSWYMSLRRSFENLQSLKDEIQNRLIPQMIQDAEAMLRTDLTRYSDRELRSEIEKRKKNFQTWQDIYWEKFIPFAHGVRLFGQFYNQSVKPNDPYEFVDLLAHTPMLSTRRNHLLETLAAHLRDNPQWAMDLQHHPERLDENFKQHLQEFYDQYANQAWGIDDTPEDRNRLVNLLLEMAVGNPKSHKTNQKNIAALELKYFNVFDPDQQEQATELLELARVSYQLRDDDNIYLGQIENAVVTAMQEFGNRTKKMDRAQKAYINYEEMIASLQEIKQAPRKGVTTSKSDSSYVLKPRQLIGQPAALGVATGKARVITESKQLFEVKSGEIVICDSIDPNMTFIVPLVAAIIERRGGMLIHGAIIAREYGIPCVTGIPEATSIIHTGDSLTVDGHLGIITIHTEPDS
jgi:rifampicin phosphotransferase